ncbi:MAG: YceI family protein [Planctomycetota bacterium]
MKLIRTALVASMALAIVPTVSALRSAKPAFNADQAGTYEIDQAHSSVVFRIKHMDVSYTYGRFNDISGKLVLSDEAGKSSLKVTVPTKSLDTNNEKRDGHLLSPDFFNGTQYPEISFETTAFTKKDDDTYTLKGNLSLHGETKPVSLDMDFVGARDTGQMGFRAGMEGELTIKRRDFGMDTYPDEAVGNEVNLYVSIEAMRK